MFNMTGIERELCQGLSILKVGYFSGAFSCFFCLFISDGSPAGPLEVIYSTMVSPQRSRDFLLDFFSFLFWLLVI